MDKVHGGTPKEGRTLCETCHHSIHVKGFNSKEHIHCTYSGQAVHFKVYECNKYVSSNTPDLVEMKKIAWVVETRNRGRWGFKPGDNPNEIIVRPPGGDEDSSMTQCAPE